MGGPRAPTYWGGILQIWTKYIYNAVRHAYLFLSNRLNPFCCILNLSTRWLERMQRPPWIIVGRRGRWRRPTRTSSSPSSTGWRRRRRRGRSTWWGEAGQRSRPLCIGFEGCNRSEDHLHLRWSLLIFVYQFLTSQDDDPCLVSTMTESLLPFLPGELFMLISLSNFTFLPGDLLLFFSFLTRRSFHVNLVWHVRYCAFDKVFLFLIWNWIFLTRRC